MLSQILQIKRPLILFDLETTSASTKEARICSFAMRVHKPDGSIRAYKTLVNPRVSIPKEATGAHSITDEIIREGCALCWKKKVEHPREDCEEFRPVPIFLDIAHNLFHGFKDADFAGYNVTFDLQVLDREFERCHLNFEWADACILDGYRLWQLLEPRSLTHAYGKFVKKRLVGAHDAMTDVLATEEVLTAQLSIKSDLPKTVEALYELSWPNQIDKERKFVFINGVPCLNFGKYNGKPMSHNVDYLKWMLGAEFSPEVKRICQKALNGEFPVYKGTE